MEVMNHKPNRAGTPTPVMTISGLGFRVESRDSGALNFGPK